MGLVYVGENVALDDILQRIDQTRAPLRGTTFRRLKQSWYASPTVATLAGVTRPRVDGCPIAAIVGNNTDTT
jgi:hypothetical protein